MIFTTLSLKKKKIITPKNLQQGLANPTKNIKNAVEEASIKLTIWEKQFFVEKNMIPTINDTTRGTEKTAYEKIKHGKRLLLMWNL